MTPGASALLPGVTVVFLSDQNDGDEESFAELLETSSILRKDAKAVRAVTRGTLDEIDNEYVAFLRDGDSYVNDYALELLVNTAAHEEAEIVGGATGEASARLSDFVFSAAWLRENADLLEILRTGDFAFIAAALARAGKAIVNERIYTKRAGGCSEPLVSVVVPAYNSEGCLDRCLESLVRQTDCNLEIIIVDDGATDATGAPVACHTIGGLSPGAAYSLEGGKSLIASFCCFALSSNKSGNISRISFSVSALVISSSCVY